MQPRVALTLWRRHRKEQVRIRNVCDREWHSLPGDGIVRDKPEHGKDATDCVTLTNWRRCRKGHARIRKGCDREWHSQTGDGIVRDNQDTERMRQRVALTPWKRHRKGQVRIRKECDREWHSQPGDGIVSDKSGYGKNATESGTHKLVTPS